MKPQEGLGADFWKDGRFGSKQSAGRVLFGQTRDDVEVERWLVEQQGGARRALVITSGGCGALTLLDVVRDEILSADINPAQNRLAALKFAAWHEDADAFESLLCGDGLKAYTRIRPTVAPAIAEYWDRHASELRRGLLHCGALDAFSRFMRTLFFFTVHNPAFTRRFLELRDVAAQRQIFENEWNTWRWRAALAIGFNPHLLRLTFSGSAAGCLPRDFPALLGERLRHWLVSHPARSNSYLWQSFLGQYPPERRNWPRYFQSGYHESNRSALAKVTLLDGDVAAILKEQEKESLDFVSLSNVLELVPDVQSVLDAAAHAVGPGGLLLSREILPGEPSLSSAGWKKEDALLADASARDRGGLSLPVLLLRRAA